MQRLILYHGDADGRCAAAIAGRHALAAGFNPVYEKMYYNTPVPWDHIRSLVPGRDQLWIVDFSLKLPDMQRIIALSMPGAASVCWIDHHKTAIEALSDFADQAGIDGLRNPDQAACILTWMYCWPKTKIPMPVRLIGDRDVWRFEYGNSTRFFYEVYLQEESVHPAADIWDRFFAIAPDKIKLKEYIDHGRALYTARIKGLRRQAASFGWPEILPGNPSKTVYKVNLPGSGDLGHVIQEMGYDVAWCFVDKLTSAGMVRTHSLYSSTVDVGDFCKHRGGGGHAGAAGYTENLS